MGRNLFIDYLKGVAIFLVVWGHGIQFLNNEAAYYDNRIFMFIYSFHMPLFMCISGYLFGFGGGKKAFLSVIKSRFQQLVIPILCWGIIFTWLVYYNDIKSLNVNNALKQYLWLYLRSLPYHLWFLWALFVISSLVSLIYNSKLRGASMNIILFLFLLGLPDNFGLSYVKFMYPFFLMGYFYNIYGHIFKRYHNAIIPICFIIFICCLFKWSKVDLIYNTKMSFYGAEFWNHLEIISHRYAIGVSGIVVVIFIVKKFLYFPRLTIISTMGVFSLGIYIIQTILFLVIDIYSPIYHVNPYLYTLFYTIVVAAIIIAFSIFSTKSIGKIPLLSRLLFGGRY